MATSAVPSSYSATTLTGLSAAAALPEVAPWRGVLAVEPDIAVLNEKSLFLTRANYCVSRATGECELFPLRTTKAFALAILSDRLGQRLLGTVAETVRRQWPRTRILILGNTPPALEDYLYDEQLPRSPDPEQVIANLEGLYQGMWNRRSNTLDWNAARSARFLAGPPMPESTETHTGPRVSAQHRSLGPTPLYLRLSGRTRP
jgi:hypothetical protein